MYEILSRLQRIEDNVSTPAYRGKHKDIVRRLATKDCRIDERCSTGLYDPVALECFDVKFKVSLGEHCFHIDTIERLLNQQGIVMTEGHLLIALREKKYIVNPLTREEVPVAKIFERIKYIMDQPYYKVHQTSLRQVVNAQVARERNKEKELEFQSVVQVLGSFADLVGAKVINTDLTIKLMNVICEIHGPSVPTFEELQEYLSFPELENYFTKEMRQFIEKEYTEKIWDSFAELFRSSKIVDNPYDVY